jgi:predicted dienelactone hydrolase
MSNPLPAGLQTSRPGHLYAPTSTPAWPQRLWRLPPALAPLLAAAMMSCLPAPAAAQVGLASWHPPTLAQPVTLVYPTTAASRPTAFGPFTIDVAVDAEPGDVRHRLVVMSHGTAGSPLPDHALAARLARAGFVVAQLLHDGDNHQDRRLAGPESFRLRPQEAVRVIDALAADPAWSARLDLGRVGVHGMSAGGVTALAGAQWRTLNLVRHCQAHPQDDEAFCFQGARSPEQRAERQARFDRARFWPDWVLPAELKAWHGGRTPQRGQDDPRPDPRIASVTAAVPVAAIFDAESLQRIRVPVGLVSARLDTVLVPRFHSSHVLAFCKRCEQLADLPAGHFDVLWPWPAGLARAVAAEQWRGGDTTPGFDPALRDAAHERIVAFHRRHLLP